jgi:hypothetical protein
MRDLVCETRVCEAVSLREEHARKEHVKSMREEHGRNM